jgi:hypothetical protein
MSSSDMLQSLGERSDCCHATPSVRSNMLEHRTERIGLTHSYQCRDGRIDVLPADHHVRAPARLAPALRTTAEGIDPALSVAGG